MSKIKLIKDFINGLFFQNENDDILVINGIELTSNNMSGLYVHSDLSLNGKKIKDLGRPIDDNDVTNKKWVLDAIDAGGDPDNNDETIFYAGGHDGSNRLNIIEYGNIADNNTNSVYGTLSEPLRFPCSTSNGKNGTAVVMGGTNGNSIVNTIQYFNMKLVSGNTSYFGDLSKNIYISSATSNGSLNKGFQIAGYTGSSYNSNIETFDITIPSDSTLHGNLTIGCRYDSATSNGKNNKAVVSNASKSNNAYTSTIEYFDMSTNSDGQLFGYLLTEMFMSTASSDDINNIAVWGGGSINTPTRINVIQYVNIVSGSNTSDFGDLTIKCRNHAANSNGVNEKIEFAGGDDNNGYSIQTRQYIIVTTPSNAVNNGNLEKAKNGHTGNMGLSIS